MMSFGDSGAAVADEQASGQVRKANIAMKLKLLNNSVIYGGSGSGQFIKEVYDLIENELEEIKIKNKQPITPELIYEMTKSYLAVLKNSKKNQFLMGSFGLTLEELQTGFKKGTRIDDQYKSKANEAINERSFKDYVNTVILLGGLCSGKFEIFLVNTDGFEVNKNCNSYNSIGSGADESDKILSQYLAVMPREKREKIAVDEGLVKLIEATNASVNMNVGVGGNPSIVYLDKNGVKEPTEEQCILASEIVEGFTRGLLERDFTYDAVSRLVIKNAGFETVEEQMKKEAKDWNKLDRILRGYKN